MSRTSPKPSILIARLERQPHEVVVTRLDHVDRRRVRASLVTLARRRGMKITTKTYHVPVTRDRREILLAVRVRK